MLLAECWVWSPPPVYDQAPLLQVSLASSPPVSMIWSCWCILETPLQSVLWWRRETLWPLQVRASGEGTWGCLWVAGGIGAQGDTGDSGG